MKRCGRRTNRRSWRVRVTQPLHPYALVIFDLDGTLADSISWFFFTVTNGVAREWRIIRMRAIDQYSLVSTNQDGRRAVLKRQGQTQVVDVDGTLLEAQFELDDGTRLIWLTDDSPYDEGLHIYLIRLDGIPEDSLQAGADFAAGILKLREVRSWSIDFEFFLNSVVYRLEIEQTLRHRLWLPTGWKYKHPLKKHRLVISQAGTDSKFDE
jgi:hypothetical protein